jgi:hypothetical protein
MQILYRKGLLALKLFSPSTRAHINVCSYRSLEPSMTKELHLSTLRIAIILFSGLLLLVSTGERICRKEEPAIK